MAKTSKQQTSKQLAATLRWARKLIADPACWCQGEYAVDAHGLSCSPAAPWACRWCALGALAAVGVPAAAPASLYRQAFVCLARALGLTEGGFVECRQAITDFNDGHTHNEVVAMFDRAIAQLEGE